MNELDENGTGTPPSDDCVPITPACAGGLTGVEGGAWRPRPFAAGDPGLEGGFVELSITCCFAGGIDGCPCSIAIADAVEISATRPAVPMKIGRIAVHGSQNAPALRPAATIPPRNPATNALEPSEESHTLTLAWPVPRHGRAWPGAETKDASAESFALDAQAESLTSSAVALALSPRPRDNVIARMARSDADLRLGLASVYDKRHPACHTSVSTSIANTSDLKMTFGPPVSTDGAEMRPQERICADSSTAVRSGLFLQPS